ncbi:MAG: AzlD domain-containing protein [Alphaproteobacteria bacterium]|nr:AzlD domain-containing protein [Alphaproteobacteria bacterium]
MPEHEAARFVLAVLAMAVVTFALRAGGMLLARRLPQSGRGALWLRQIPPAVLAAIVAPAILNGGPAEAIGAATTAAAAALSRNLFLAMALGLGAALLLRQALGA